MPSPRFVLALDQGTTGSTAIAIGEDGAILGKVNREFPQHFPQPGWVEHDLDEIWVSLRDATEGLFAATSLRPSDCVAIGITNQRETVALWERQSGAPAHRAVVWQDRRTAEFCQQNKADEQVFRDKTGLVLDPYFSGTKVRWLLENVDGLRARAQDGDVVFGTIDSWLVHRLSGGQAHVTDVSNASRTLLFDIHEMKWSSELCERLTVPATMLPEVRSCSEVYAKTSGVGFLPDGIPIAGMAGDQQAALFGQTCFEVGEAKCTYGTGAFLLMNIGAKALVPPKGLLTTVAWTLNGETSYAYEGSAFVAGAAVQWLRDGLGLIDTAPQIADLAAQVRDAGGVYFVPALAGLGAPHWDPDARGLICGLSRGTTKAHIARATLEGIAYQIYDLVEAMLAQANNDDLRGLRVDGGAANNNLLMQFQADILGSNVTRPVNVETTAVGAAFLAGLGVGFYSEPEKLRAIASIDKEFEPNMDEGRRKQHIKGWNDAVARTRSS